MIAAFMTHWPKTMPGHLAGQRTDFVEKIRNCLFLSRMFTAREMASTFPKTESIYRIETSMTDERQKLHTIREDKGDRWKAGNDIHFYINCRQKDMFRFAPVVKCKSVQ